MSTGVNDKRKRSSSLRTQMFNKHLYDKFRGKSAAHTDLGDITENYKEETILEDEEMDTEDRIAEAIENSSINKYIFKILDYLLNRKSNGKTIDGRRIPVVLDHNSHSYLKFLASNSLHLNNEQTNKPYCDNQITSSRYTIYTFFPSQLHAQFSKLANIYFFAVAILQIIPGWSATGRFTTIIPICVFMGISMAREAWDDFKRHKLDKEENKKVINILVKHTYGEANLPYNQNSSADSAFDAYTASKSMDNDEFGESSKNINSKFNSYTFEENKGNVGEFNDFAILNDEYNISLREKYWKDLQVGDFVLLKQDDWVPADILLLTSDGHNNGCFVETMALDGETNLKGKQPHPKINELCCQASGLANVDAELTVENPNNDLYNFEGNIQLQDPETGSVNKYSLGPDNVIYRGSILRNTNHAVGIVIFTGEETKIRMNAIKNPRTKAPKLQSKVNWIILFMVFVVVTITLFSFLGHQLSRKKYIDGNEAWYLFQQDSGIAPTIISYLIMYNTLIPLSLYVTMEIIKVVQGKFMEWDIDMYYSESDTPCESRSATILEELGQVSYIFSDKTGTLTDNKMLFRKFSICGSSWFHRSLTEEPDILDSFPEGNDLEVQSIDDKTLFRKLSVTSSGLENSSPQIRPSVDYKGNSSAFYTGRPSMKFLYEGVRKSMSSINEDDNVKSKENFGKMKTSYDLISFIQQNPNSLFAHKARFFLLSLALCHTCLPRKMIGDGIEETIEYQSSSPDELALITAARELGYIVSNRNGQTLTIKTYPHGLDSEPVSEDYEILNVVEFNSQRKRMSVLVRCPNESDRVLLICKGADNVILDLLQDKDLVEAKLGEADQHARVRKDAEAKVVIDQRLSLQRMATENDPSLNRLKPSVSNIPRESLSLAAIRNSISQQNKNLDDNEMQFDSLNKILSVVSRTEQEVEAVIAQSRQSLHKQQLLKYGPRLSMDPKMNSPKLTKSPENTSVNQNNSENIFDNYIASDELIADEEFVLEKTLQAIDEFSTDGLRTLLYSYKWVDETEYKQWDVKYNKAKTSLTNRSTKIDEVGGEIEFDLKILGVSAIEDKLQEGVPEAIEKIRRAGIKMWMLTGDKRETAINIGYSCNLIYDYSTVVVLTTSDENILLKLNALSQEIDSGNVAHCVIVVDGATLAMFEENLTFMSVFVELCIKADSVICCRASPSQKALMVTHIRNTNKSMVTLAIGDGANDIAMIQSADIGVGIAGKEGLQASRSSDYSIGQFRFLLKLLFVHGRYNYIRTSKFILCTFYKEITFYLTQLIFQRFTAFSGTSLYESWSLSMFNTLFTSLPVLCIGMFEEDLKPITLLSVPELYSHGRLCKEFNLWIFAKWAIHGTINSLLIMFLSVVIWGVSSFRDNTVYPLSIVNYTAIVLLTNVKCQILEMNNRTWIAFASIFISCGGWLLWIVAIPVINKADVAYDVKYGFIHNFGKDITFWCSIAVLCFLPVMIDVIIKTLKHIFAASDADIFSELEQKAELRKRLELGAYNEMKQGWTWQTDPGTIKRYKKKIMQNTPETSTFSDRSEASDIIEFVESDFKLEPSKSDSSKSAQNGKYDSKEYEQLPSGKFIKISDSNSNDSSERSSTKITKKLRFAFKNDSEEDVMAIINQRMQDLE